MDHAAPPPAQASLHGGSPAPHRSQSGCTLVSALAVRGAWITDSGIIARPSELSDAFRRVPLVFRRSYPRRVALEACSDIIRNNLPNTVHEPGTHHKSGRHKSS